MSVANVLAAAADRLDQMEQHRADRDLRHGAGGAIYCLIYETAKQLYGWTAIQHLEHVLQVELPGGQLQHWRETDRAVVAKTLREAAAAPVADDVEVLALRAQLAGFRQALADATGWHHLDVATLVHEIRVELARLREANERLTVQLEARHRRVVDAVIPVVGE